MCWEAVVATFRWQLRQVLIIDIDLNKQDGLIRHYLTKSHGCMDVFGPISPAATLFALASS